MEDFENILIVDDDERIRDLLAETFKKRGIPVSCARDGEEAFQMFTSEPFSILITDIMLPKMDGIKLVEKIRAHVKGKSLPIIMMSAVYRDLKMQGDLKVKFNVQFLVKPFSLKVLLQMLESILKKNMNPDPANKETVKDSAQEIQTEPFRQGNLEHFAIPVILVSFFSQGKTGILTLKHTGKNVKIYLDQGIPVYAEGRVSLNTKEEVEEVLRSCFAWIDGQYSFEPLELLPSEIPKFRYDFYDIVFEGAKRYYRLACLIGKLEKFQGHKVVRREDFLEKVAHLSINEKEKLTIRNIDDVRTVSDLVTYAPGEIESVFQMLWILQFMDAISFQI